MYVCKHVDASLNYKDLFDPILVPRKRNIKICPSRLAYSIYLSVTTKEFMSVTVRFDSYVHSGQIYTLSTFCLDEYVK